MNIIIGALALLGIVAVASWIVNYFDIESKVSINDVQRDIKQWADRAIPHRSWGGQIHHLRSEIDELEREEQNKANMAHEMADIVILTLNLAGMKDIDLQTAIIEKMKINKKRTWGAADPRTGQIHHEE
jgi:NTP pyrophosphatase (non-canonical NTP hydrolase)